MGSGLRPLFTTESKKQCACGQPLYFPLLYVTNLASMDVSERQADHCPNLECNVPIVDSIDVRDLSSRQNLCLRKDSGFTTDEIKYCSETTRYEIIGLMIHIRLTNSGHWVFARSIGNAYILHNDDTWYQFPNFDDMISNLRANYCTAVVSAPILMLRNTHQDTTVEPNVVNRKRSADLVSVLKYIGNTVLLSF